MSMRSLAIRSAANEYSGGASIDVPLSDRFVVHVDGSYRNSDDLAHRRLSAFAEHCGRKRSISPLTKPLWATPPSAANATALAGSRGRLPNSGVEDMVGGRWCGIYR